MRPLSPRAKRVLVVDDDLDLVELVAMLLTQGGHYVAVARDAVEAFAVALDFRPEVAVLDIGLPDTSGYELAQRFRESKELEGCRLIALTASADESDRRKSEAAGFYAHLTKPFDDVALLAAIDGPSDGASCAPATGWAK